MFNGRIKSLKFDKGFGFISGEGGRDDAFFHCSAVLNRPFLDLVVGEKVTYELTRGKDGRARAENVTAQ